MTSPLGDTSDWAIPDLTPQESNDFAAALNIQQQPCPCEALLRADAEDLLTNADQMKARGHHKNAEASRRHAMSLALAAGHLRRHEKEKP